MTTSRQLVEQFFQGIARGELPEHLLTPEMTVWTLSSGQGSRERFETGVRILASLFNGSLAYTIDTLTAQDDRVIVEVQSTGKLVNGEEYHNYHVFAFQLDDGRISGVREYMNPIVVKEKLAPLMAAAMAGSNS